MKQKIQAQEKTDLNQFSFSWISLFRMKRAHPIQKNKVVDNFICKYSNNNNIVRNTWIQFDFNALTGISFVHQLIYRQFIVDSVSIDVHFLCFFSVILNDFIKTTQQMPCHPICQKKLMK